MAEVGPGLAGKTQEDDVSLESSDRGEKLGRHITFQQPAAVLGEGGGVPHRVLDPRPTNQWNNG
jgi:hypothetical protein